MKKPITVDFESEAIQPRPEYPPKPVGVAIKYPGRKGRYYAFGHPTENNCTEAQARGALKDVYDSGAPLLFQYGKFDADVAEVRWKLKMPSWERIHDTLYAIFLKDPHASTFSLKPSAERILGIKPEEQERVRDWLIAKGIVAKNDKKWGAHICKAPGKLVGEYAIGDVDRTDLLFNHIVPEFDKGMRQAYDRERRLMPILLENERTGMRVDVEGLERDIPLFEKAVAKADAWLRKRLRAPGLNLDSDEDVAAALDKANMITEWRLTPKKQEKSVSKKYLTVDKFRDPKVASVFGYRNRMCTVLSMSMRPWLEMATRLGGYIATSWNQVRQEHGGGLAGTRTARLSCSYFMNITKDYMDKDDGYVHPKFLGVPELPRVRCYILPDEGAQFCHRDYRQQELRILGHYEDGALCRAYNADNNVDVHVLVHDLIRDITGLDLHRRQVKIMNFLQVYGGGVPAIMEKLKCDKAQATRIRGAHKAALPDVQALDAELKARGRRGEPVREWGGGLIYCEAPRPINGKMRTFEYKMLNYLIQRSAASCTKEAVIRYNEAKKNGRFLVTVHDEINISVPNKAVESEMKILNDVMASAKFDVPMLSDGKVGPTWGELKKYED